MKKLKLILLSFTGLLIALLATLCLFLFFFDQDRDFETKTFDAKVWRESLLIETNTVRLQMVDDLLEKDLLKEKTKDEIIALLGTPPPTSYFSDWDMVYWLGPERSKFGIDSEWLVLKFKNEKVDRYKIVTD